MKQPNVGVKLSLWLLGCIISVGSVWGYAVSGQPATQLAPESLAGMTMNLQIEQTVSKLTSGFATQGAVARAYDRNGQWQEIGAGGPEHAAATGRFTYRLTGPDSAEEQSVNPTFNNASSVMRFHFDTPTQGSWQMDWDQRQIVFSGRFSLIPTATSADFAPSTLAGQHVALMIDQAQSTTLPAGTYPQRGLVLQTYHRDGSMVLKGFGPGSVDSIGTYRYTKLSANTAVEEVAQVSKQFSYPYTMVYTYLTPTSGTWFQNFGNGLILFSGTFNIFSQ